MEVDQQPQRPPGYEISSEGLLLSLSLIQARVFTSLTRRLGINGLELVELYDIEPWAVDHLNPHGLIFCFMWRKDSHRPADFDDPAAERVWFANQLSDDACATHAILNVLLNCPNIDIGEEMRNFRAETEMMSPVMRGLAITNSRTIRPAHNFFARPSDIRASLNNITITTFDAEKRKAKAKKSESEVKPPPAKRAKIAKTTKSKGKEKEKDSTGDDDEEETYHFIGYVPAHGKVWELDGLKSGPLEVGELPAASTSSSADVSPSRNSNRGWMDIVRPALRMKMEKYGGSGSDESNIRFSLLAIVDDLFKKVSDELELLKREKKALEGRMNQECNGWQTTVDSSLYELSHSVFLLPNQRSLELRKPYAPDFGSRANEQARAVLTMNTNNLIPAWEMCVRTSIRARVAVEDELTKGVRANTDHVKRTFDYEPFVKEYIRHLQSAGLLDALLDRDGDGRKRATAKKGLPNT
ncbi:hypothetical protein B0H34DRAFT_800760 [Crassisporium funariophilum]|nr:hypothetical protein B0H34DRAFT_800760 [Crassisporium funariophilum]